MLFGVVFWIALTALILWVIFRARKGCDHCDQVKSAELRNQWRNDFNLSSLGVRLGSVVVTPLDDADDDRPHPYSRDELCEFMASLFHTADGEKVTIGGRRLADLTDDERAALARELETLLDSLEEQSKEEKE